MPLFMDTHRIDGGVAVDAVAKAHLADLQTQDRYGVRYLRYWVNEGEGKVFCLVDAPDADWPTASIARRTVSSPTASTRSSRAFDEAIRAAHRSFDRWQRPARARESPPRRRRRRPRGRFDP